jgi:hypothetical protein
MWTKSNAKGQLKGTHFLSKRQFTISIQESSTLRHPKLFLIKTDGLRIPFQRSQEPLHNGKWEPCGAMEYMAIGVFSNPSGCHFIIPYKSLATEDSFCLENEFSNHLL